MKDKNNFKAVHYPNREEIDKIKEEYSYCFKDIKQEYSDFMVMMLKNIDYDTILFKKLNEVFKNTNFHKFTGIQAQNGPVSFSYLLSYTKIPNINKVNTLTYDEIKDRYEKFKKLMPWKIENNNSFLSFEKCYKNLLISNIIYEMEIYKNNNGKDMDEFDLEREIDIRFHHMYPIHIYDIETSFNLYKNCVPAKSFKFATYEELIEGIDKVVIDEIIKYGNTIIEYSEVDDKLYNKILLEKNKLIFRNNRGVGNILIVPKSIKCKFLKLGIDSLFDEFIVLSDNILKDKFIISYSGSTSYDNGLIVSPYILYSEKQKLPDELINLTVSDILLSNEPIEASVDVCNTRLGISTFDDSSESRSLEQVKNYYTVFDLNYEISNLIKKWKPLLEIGRPVLDEENAVVFLESIQNNIMNKNKHFKYSNIFITIMRRLLSNLKLEHDPEFKIDNPSVMKFSTEFVEDFFQHSNDLDSELVDVITQDLLMQCEAIGENLIVNFDVNDDCIKLHVKGVK